MKKICKKYKTLEEDLKIFIGTQIFLYHKLNKDNQGVYLISGLGIEGHSIFKAKKFACKSIPGKGCRTGIRIIYAYYEKFNEKDKVTLIEIYHKNVKANEDRDRIYKNFNNQ